MAGYYAHVVVSLAYHPADGDDRVFYMAEVDYAPATGNHSDDKWELNSDEDFAPHFAEELESHVICNHFPLAVSRLKQRFRNKYPLGWPLGFCAHTSRISREAGRP